MEQLGGIILAAGLSSRMEDFKPLMKIGEKTLIERVVSGMQRAGAERIVVVTGYCAEKIEKQLKNSGVIFIRNEKFAETEMFDSLKLGLMNLRNFCGKILVSPADVPLVQPETIRLLQKTDAPFVRPVCGGKAGHPALISGSLVPALCDCSGSDGLRGALRSLGIEPLNVWVDDAGTILDADTPEDFLKLLSQDAKIRGERSSFGLRLKIGLQGENLFFDQFSAQFLELVDITGSIQTACTSMHISYTKGWSMINSIEQQLGFKVLKRVSGGSDGGNSSLTEEGWNFLCAYKEMSEEIIGFSQEVFAKYSQKINIKKDSD